MTGRTVPSTPRPVAGIAPPPSPSHPAVSGLTQPTAPAFAPTYAPPAARSASRSHAPPEGPGSVPPWADAAACDLAARV